LWNRELIAEGHELALYDEAIALATNDTERTFLETRRARLTPDP
jgi:predicted RNA polymerase sigma factor